jgi:hypothetical protein
MPTGRTIEYLPDDAMEDLMAGDAPHADLLVMTRSAEIPTLAGAEG